MPYIKKEQKAEFASLFDELALKLCKHSKEGPDSGLLNFLLTRTIQEYIARKGESYQTYNDCLGALTGCQMELYRRRIQHFEDGKILLNGDVYAPGAC